MPASDSTDNEEATAQDFQGFIAEIGPLALPWGAMVKQENMMNSGRGTLKSRPGLRPVTFEDD